MKKAELVRADAAKLLTSREVRAAARELVRAGARAERTVATRARRLFAALGLAADADTDLVTVLLRADEQLLPRPVGRRLARLDMALLDLRLLRRAHQRLAELASPALELRRCVAVALSELHALAATPRDSARGRALRALLASELGAGVSR
ncbi:MAG: hypothetical protein IT370_16380 [Deltaproteobacteria bacterium]|nr:hypothetical protein [Deltaproteobacteria bacterium]